MRGAFRRTAWSLAFLFIVLVCVGALFEEELMAAAQWTERTIGDAGLAAFVFFADSFTLPFPRDLTLIVVANSARRADWLWIVPLLGGVSAAGGVLGWWIGTRLSGTRWVSRIKQQMERRQSTLVTRYGGLAVAVWRANPGPIFITCGAVGALALPFRTFILLCCLRVPRFIAYHWMLANATRASAWLGSWLAARGDVLRGERRRGPSPSNRPSVRPTSVGQRRPGSSPKPPTAPPPRFAPVG